MTQLGRYIIRSMLSQAVITKPFANLLYFSYPDNLARSDLMDIVKILLAIFLPPVAAFIQVGPSLHFWVNILLTILGVLPGMVHALWLIVTKK